MIIIGFDSFVSFIFMYVCPLVSHWTCRWFYRWNILIICISETKKKEKDIETVAASEKLSHWIPCIWPQGNDLRIINKWKIASEWRIKKIEIIHRETCGRIRLLLPPIYSKEIRDKITKDLTLKNMPVDRFLSVKNADCAETRTHILCMKRYKSKWCSTILQITPFFFF